MGGVLNYLSSITYNPDESQAWLTATKSHTFGGTLVGEQTLKMDSDNTVRTVIIAFDTDSRN